MRAMVLDAPGRPLREEIRTLAAPGPTQVRLQVLACGVCRTDLHLVDGELPPRGHPVVPGHELVGRVIARGAQVPESLLGARVGVPWLGWTCGACDFCRRGAENLCVRARFTGYDLDGGYADLALADARYCVPLPAAYADVHAAPLLCAGLIGYRAWSLAGDARVVGLYGFGAAAHVLCQVLVAEGRRVLAFTRPGDLDAQGLARRLGAAWAGGSDEPAPHPLDAALLFAPAGALVPIALRAVRPGGTVVCGGIHMSDIPSFPYALLWGERTLRSVANLTRADAARFMEVAARVPLRTEVRTFPLAQANEALDALRSGRFAGALVLTPD
jgi:propanol-preferring alcohol dehydrogenase